MFFTKQGLSRYHIPEQEYMLCFGVRFNEETSEYVMTFLGRHHGLAYIYYPPGITEKQVVQHALKTLTYTFSMVVPG